MRKERKAKTNLGQACMAVGPKVEASFDHQVDILSIRCRESGFTARMHISEKMEAEYYRHDGTLIMGGSMALQIQCTAEEAAELAGAIGSPGLSSFEIVG